MTWHDRDYLPRVFVGTFRELQRLTQGFPASDVRRVRVVGRASDLDRLRGIHLSREDIYYSGEPVLDLGIIETELRRIVVLSSREPTPEPTQRTGRHPITEITLPDQAHVLLLNDDGTVTWKPLPPDDSPDTPGSS